MEIVEEAEVSSHSHEKYENMQDKTGQELGLMAEIRFDWQWFLLRMTFLFISSSQFGKLTS